MGYLVIMHNLGQYQHIVVPTCDAAAAALEVLVSESPACLEKGFQLHDSMSQ